MDDNHYNLEVLSRRLIRRSYKTTCVESGEEALERLKTETFDLMLLDIMMPGIDGMEVLAQCRRTFSKAELPIIMVTSRNESEDVVEALHHGANDYVVKPIDFPVALARIEKELSARRESDRSRPTVNAYSLVKGEKFGPYLIKEKVGQGGMGAVYKVLDPSLDRVVALKVILEGREMTSAQVERFKREARAIAQIKHRNIVSVYHIEENPRHYFVMDFVEGDTLSDWIHQEKVDVDKAGEVAQKIASALVAAHEKGIIHRDLKSSNIMMDKEGEPHLMDFGLAKLESEEEQITRTGDMLGTPEFMAPEQVDPTHGVTDHRSDVYSLGAILYEMLTGKPPFTGTTIQVLWQKLNQDPAPPASQNPAVSAQLESICLRALEKVQENRFQTAQEMFDALDLVV